MRRPSLRARAILAALCLPLLALSPAQAADVVATWVSVTGNWSDGSNWSTDPDYPNNNGLTYDAVINSGTVTQDLDVTIDALTLAGGALGGNHRLILQQGGSCTDASIAPGGGALEVRPGATLTLNGLNETSRDFDNSGTVIFGGILEIAEYAYVAFDNRPGALFDMVGNGSLVYDRKSKSRLFTNAGTLRKSGGTGYGQITWWFSNSGTVRAESGILALALQPYGSSTGEFYADEGAALHLNVTGGGAHEFAAGSSITGPGSVRFGGPVDVNGTFSVTGTVEVARGPASFNVAPAPCNHLVISSGFLDGTADVAVSGSLDWMGGGMVGTGATVIQPGAALGIGGTYLHLGRTLENYGRATVHGAESARIWTVESDTQATFNNKHDAVFELQTDMGFLISRDDPSLLGTYNNEGVFLKSGGAGVTESEWVFNNDGTVTVASGVLRLLGGGEGRGTFDLSSGAALEFAGGTHLLHKESSIAGDGHIWFTNGTTTVSGSYDISGVSTFSGGTVTFNGAWNSAAGSVFDGADVTFNTPPGAPPYDMLDAIFNGGTITFNGNVNVNPDLQVNGSQINFNGDPLSFATLGLSAGSIGGSAAITLNREVTWTGGTMGGTGETEIAHGAFVDLGGGAGQVLGRTFVNNGWVAVADHLAASPTPGDTPTIHNRADGVFDLQGGAGFTGTGADGPAVFENAGTLRAAASASFSTGWILNNSGAVYLQAPVGLWMRGGGTHTGVFYLAPGAELAFGRDHHLQPEATVNGGGRLEFFGGNALMDGAVNVTGAFEFTGGTAHFNGPMAPAVATLLVYSGEAHFDSNAVTFTNVRVEGGLVGGSADLAVTAEFDWEGGTMTGSGITEIAPGAVFDIDEDETKYLSRRIDNYGLTTIENPGNLSACAGGGGAIFNNRPGATFELNSEADFTYTDGPDAVFNNEGTFTKALDTGTTHFSSHWTFNNSGTFSAQDGSLDFRGPVINSGMFQAQDSTLDFKGPVSNSGTLDLQNCWLTFKGPLNNTGTVEVHGNKTVKLHGGGICSGALTVDSTAAIEFAGVHTFTDTATFSGPGAISVASGVLNVETAIQGNNMAVNVWNDARADFRGLPRLARLGLHGTSVTTFALGATGPVRTDSFSLTEDAGGAPTATLDLTDNSLLVDYTGQVTPFGDFERWISSALYTGPGGKWTGPGITSSAAAAHPQGLAAVGVIDNSDALFEPQPELEGVPVTPQTILVKYTWFGDANLDGVVDSNDYDRIDTFWILWTEAGIMPAGGFRWAVGDFNYDGTLDSNDYDLIDNTWILSDGASLHGPAPIPTPEPASTALVLAGLAFLAWQARSRRRG